jgi:putative methionine-R-sulfoxide reductase with GAF domain
MQGLAQPEDPFRSTNGEDTNAGTDQSSESGTGSNKPKGNRLLDGPELDSALQLLVERAQYITGATGTALALPQGNEMVCRASAGSSAPAVGARLQVLSGLTGESISRRQLLRCDNAETDPRVNLEACRALGIASIVVLPLFRNSGDIRGLIELFSDHPYAFEERDLVALERMADLTLTALDLAEQKQNPAPGLPLRRRELDKSVQPATRGSGAEPRSYTGSLAAASPVSSPSPAAVPDAMRRMQKCDSCGFPISDGRTLCLDCEKKNTGRKDSANKPLVLERGEIKKPEQATPHASPGPAPEEFVPAFLVNAASMQKPWLANPVNLLAIIVLIVAILVAVVVFR